MPKNGQFKFLKSRQNRQFCGIFNQLLSNKIVYVARFARNDKCDFFCDFQPPWMSKLVFPSKPIFCIQSCIFFFCIFAAASRNFQAENREGEISNNSAFFTRQMRFFYFEFLPFEKKVCLAPEKTSDP